MNNRIAIIDNGNVLPKVLIDNLCFIAIIGGQQYNLKDRWCLTSLVGATSNDGYFVTNAAGAVANIKAATNSYVSLKGTSAVKNVTLAAGSS